MGGLSSGLPVRWRYIVVLRPKALPFDPGLNCIVKVSFDEEVEAVDPPSELAHVDGI